RISASEVSSVALAQSSAVLGGLPYWDAAGGSFEGLKVTLGESLTSLTVAFLMRTPLTSTYSIPACLGDDSGSRSMILFSTGGVAEIQHGTTDRHTDASQSVAANTWTVGFWTFDESDNGAQLYIDDSVTPQMDETMVNNLSSSLIFSIFASGNGTLPGQMDEAVVRVWNKVLDADERATVMRALGNIRDA
ncbi:MAG: LamG-like jellyroll fold domain-containing protein, partial [Pseudomonadota bacterium]|nr:LamG-like jellyroll fold domain-containing protein [Pseudomonadota bacterium]